MLQKKSLLLTNYQLHKFAMDANIRIPETKVASELVEFDLDSILAYADADFVMKKRKKQESSRPLSPTNEVSVILRNLVCHMKSPVALDPQVILQYSQSGLESKVRGSYKFSTEHFEVKAGTETPLLTILNKARGSIKKCTLISINILDDKIRGNVFDELRFITNKIKKCKQHFTVTHFQLDLVLNTRTNMVTFGLNYNITLKQLFYRYFSSDVSTALLQVLSTHMELLPTEINEFVNSFKGFAPDTHLFYRAITDNTARMPPASSTFYHPQLFTELLPFQRKSVGWLLSKEGVVYDEVLRSCRHSPLISDQVGHLLQLYPQADVNELDRSISHILDRICYGWNRVLFKGQICWVNHYTGNIMLLEQIVAFLLEYYRTNNQHKIPGCGLLSEEMGLGKTVEIMDLVLLNPRPTSEVGEEITLQFKEEGDFRLVRKGKTTLIAAPDSILHQWYREIAQLCPSLSVTIYKGLGKYPELSNVPRYIGEYLQRFDIVLMNYATMSREMDYANYSSRHIPTRGGRKRNGDVDKKDENPDGKTNKINEGTNKEVNGELPEETMAALVNEYKAELNPVRTPEATFNQKKYERAVLEELAGRVRREDPRTIPHTHFYESPLMLCQWWRVVLDEVQMVSSGASRAFKTAALIPRFHSWGVSGTPARLPAVLQFLKFAPFNYDISKYCWKQLTAPENSNADFIRIWLSISLRHTKAMVHDDIKLPPQQRVLLTMPFTKVEQDKYDQMFESTLASIGIYTDKVPKRSEIELTTSACVHLRSWLVKLRQLCGNLQVGQLAKAHTLRGKNKNKFLLHGIPELKTLEDVLDDMIDSVLEDIGESKRGIINRLLEISLLLEYVLYPQKVIDIINVVLSETQKFIEKVIAKSHRDSQQYQKLRQILIEHGALEKKDMEGLSDDEQDEQEAESSGNEDEAEHIPVIKKENEKDVPQKNEGQVQEAISSFQKYKELVQSNKMRLRSWKMTQHKCYFLLASAHFQLYDEEYQQKILNLRIPFDSLLEIDVKVHQNGLLDTDEISLYSDIELGKSEQVDYLALFKPEEGLSNEQREMEKNKFLEQNYYSLAEECRKDILKHSIKDVDLVTSKRLTSRSIIKQDTWVNNGDVTIPKSSKKLCTAIPLIDISDVNQFVGDMKTKQLINQFNKLFTQLNEQAKVINEFVQQLLTVLSNPLLSSEKSPDGEEYEQSIQDQDQASCLMLVITQLLTDRSNATLETKTKITEITKQQDHDYKLEFQRANDRKFLKALQAKRVKSKPDLNISFEELLQDARLLEAEMRDNYRSNVQEEVYEEIVRLLRTVYENEKNCQSMLQKELNSSFNAVFNARVEYFKQLQQISDSVETKKFSFLQEDLSAKCIDGEFQTLFNYLAGARNKLTRGLSRYRYLATLIPSDESKNIKKENIDIPDSQEEVICIICQTGIKVGSLTSCGHKFCKSCLDEWLSTGHSWCPMCKTYTDRDTVYYFTHYKSDLKAHAVENGNKEDSQLEAHHSSSIHQIYKQMDPEVLKQIQRIKLSNSYGSKVDMIVKQVLHLRSMDPNVQIVIFSQWQDLLVILAFAFDKAKISYVSAKGSHVAAYKSRRVDPVEDFKNTTSIKTCFLLNAQAQASGLTLINATHIFLCEPLVNTPTELQAISRIHRIGQKNVTTVWMFAIENSVEENIVAIGTKKRLEYLRANAKENHIQAKEDVDQMVETDIRTAESFALTLGQAVDNGRQFSGNSESIADSDLWNVYFGEET